MATGNYFAALAYELYIAAGTTSSTAPTYADKATLTQVLSVDNAGIQGSSDTQKVLDYGSELGYGAQLVTGQSYTIPVSMNLDLTDAGYAIFKQAGLDAAAGTTVEWLRVSPVTDGSTDTPEWHAGVALVSNFREEIQAGNVAKVSFDLLGIGAPDWTVQTAVGP